MPRTTAFHLAVAEDGYNFRCNHCRGKGHKVLEDIYEEVIDSLYNRGAENSVGLARVLKVSRGAMRNRLLELQIDGIVERVDASRTEDVVWRIVGKEKPKTRDCRRCRGTGHRRMSETDIELLKFCEGTPRTIREASRELGRRHDVIRQRIYELRAAGALRRIGGHSDGKWERVY